jgi:hypothetical protein
LDEDDIDIDGARVVGGGVDDGNGSADDGGDVDSGGVDEGGDVDSGGVDEGGEADKEAEGRESCGWGGKSCCSWVGLKKESRGETSPLWGCPFVG